MIVDLQLNKQLSARDSRGLKLMRIKPVIERDTTRADGGKLTITFLEGDVKPFSVPLYPTEKELESWEL